MADRLPIYEIETPLVAAIRDSGRLIVCAPTGSGKSTQVPQMLADHGVLGDGQVVILQPRRLAARLLATRVARERKSELGREVGYQIRFENVTSAATRIRFVTEGVLLRQMVQDPALKGVSALVFDEFHERHLYGDITLGQALQLQETTRPDLKILVMSATLDVMRLQEYLRPVRILESQGRMYPVDIQYSKTPAYVDKRPVAEQAAAAFTEYVQSGNAGDVLVFMPGGFEISQTMQAIRQRPEAEGFLVLPLHGELAPRDQDAAVARYGQRKVIVSTNVAETSLTIDGIRCVIDSGLARQARYDAHRGINTLLIEKISRASADQRAGRAGRTAPGVCLRLWSREEHGHRAAQELPEVKRLDLAEVLLTLKAAGVGNVRKFRWLEAPDEHALAHAEELLLDLGALKRHPDAGTEITTIGRKMLAFPLHPRYARMLLAAQDYGCVHQACLIAALTQGRDLLVRNPESTVAKNREALLGDDVTSDFWLLIRLWTEAQKSNHSPDICRKLGLNAAAARQVEPLFRQFIEIAQREGLDATKREAPSDSLRKCILTGFVDRVARRLDASTGRCELVHGRRATLARESVVRDSPLFVAAEAQEIEGREKDVTTLLSLATAIEEKWLGELFPDDISTTLRVFYDPPTRRVYAEEQSHFRELSIGSRRIEPPPADDAARLLTDEVLAGRLQLSAWDEGVDQWILRLNLLGQWCPELALPQITEDDRRSLIEQICHGSFSAKEIRDLPVRPQVMGWLSGAQQKLLEKHAPEKLTLPGGRTPRIHYEKNGPPYIAARIQELFGLNATPRIAMGKIPIVVHILTPGMKPVQITTDLASFWRDQYPRIKQELQRKYPRHKWL